MRDRIPARAAERLLATHPQVISTSEERLSDEVVAAVADAGRYRDRAGMVEVAGLEVCRSASIGSFSCRNKPPIIRVKQCFADTLDFDFVGLDRASARTLSVGKGGADRATAQLRVQLRSFDAVCRLVECNVGSGRPATTAEAPRQTMSDHRVELTRVSAAS